jgi:glutamate dehydrogenase
MIKGNSVNIELFETVRLFMQKSIFWFLRNQPQPLDVGIIIEKFEDGVALLLEKAERLFTGVVKDLYEYKVSYFDIKKVPKNLSTEISRLSLLPAIMDVIEVSKATNVSVLDVGKIYFYVGEKLDYNWLRDQVEKLPNISYWDRMLVNALESDINDQQRRVLKKIVCSSGVKFQDKCSLWEKNHEKELGVFYTFISSLKDDEEINIAKLVVATKQSAILVN